MSSTLNSPSAGCPHPAEGVTDPAAADSSSTAAAERTQTPGEYVGEAESRESAHLALHIAERLVTPRPDCMIWTGATDRGYGRISIKRQSKRVHRIVWEMKFGPVPEGLTIDHLCRVRACCNTDHMELVTGAENARRAAPYRPRLAFRVVPRRSPRPNAAPRGQETHCRNGHEYAPDNFTIRSDGTRRCLGCRKAQREQERARRREQQSAKAA